MSDKFKTLEPGTFCELRGDDLSDEFGVLRGSFDDLDMPRNADWILDSLPRQMVVIRDTRNSAPAIADANGGVLFLTAIGPIWVKWWFMVHIHKVLTP